MEKRPLVLFPRCFLSEKSRSPPCRVFFFGKIPAPRGVESFFPWKNPAHRRARSFFSRKKPAHRRVGSFFLRKNPAHRRVRCFFPRKKRAHRRAGSFFPCKKPAHRRAGSFFRSIKIRVAKWKLSVVKQAGLPREYGGSTVAACHNPKSRTNFITWKQTADSCITACGDP